MAKVNWLLSLWSRKYCEEVKVCIPRQLVIWRSQFKCNFNCLFSRHMFRKFVFQNVVKACLSIFTCFVIWIIQLWVVFFYKVEIFVSEHGDSFNIGTPINCWIHIVANKSKVILCEFLVAHFSRSQLLRKSVLPFWHRPYDKYYGTWLLLRLNLHS